VSDVAERRIYSLRIVTYYQLHSSIEPSGGGSVVLSPAGENYENGAEVTATAVAAEGYAFDHWSGDVPAGHENDNSVAILMDSDKSLTAHFAQVVPFYTLSVSASPSEGGSVTLDPSKDEYMVGSTVTLTAVPAENYEFDRWSGDASGTSATMSVIMDSDKGIIAHFKAKEPEEGVSMGWIWAGTGVIVAVIVGALLLKRH